MSLPKKIFAIIGSTRKNSSNEIIVRHLKTNFANDCEIELYNTIESLPHFNPDLDQTDPPGSVIAFRNKISEAEGVIICTPEYVFSLPGSLKNAIEWTVSTTVFSDKPISLITAAASGEKAHESLQLIMKTLMTKFNTETTLLIKGIKGKTNGSDIADPATVNALGHLMRSFIHTIGN